PETVGLQFDRLLTTPAARAWLTKLMEIYFGLNELPYSYIDTNRFPEATPALLADMQTEAHMFLDATLWDGALTDLLTSRTTFLNSTLATTIYKVPVPSGATATDFVPTTLPTDQRSGILTNAAFITVSARSNGTSVVSRGKWIDYAMVGFVFQS